MAFLSYMSQCGYKNMMEIELMIHHMSFKVHSPYIPHRVMKYGAWCMEHYSGSSSTFGTSNVKCNSIVLNLCHFEQTNGSTSNCTCNLDDILMVSLTCSSYFCCFCWIIWWITWIFLQKPLDSNSSNNMVVTYIVPMIGDTFRKRSSLN